MLGSEPWDDNERATEWHYVAGRRVEAEKGRKERERIEQDRRRFEDLYVNFMKYDYVDKFEICLCCGGS